MKWLLDRVSLIPIKLRQYRYRTSTSAPYLSGDAFAALCDISVKHVPLTSDEVLKLRQARSIFIQSHLLENFLESYWAEVMALVLVTGNSDRNFDQPIGLPPSVALWLCQNSAINVDAKVHTLPIGIENIALGKNGLTKFYAKKKKNKIVDKVLVPPMSETNPIRAKIIQEAKNRVEIFDIQNKYISTRKYFALAARYKFVLCLEGNGYENHRIWETLYNDSFPILLSSAWSETLKELNLPILIVSEIDELSIRLLSEFAQKNKDFKALKSEKLWIPAWKSIICSGIYT